jgi:antitoxin component of RelBE/YafQ-DinJ toxin-antitoxin module
MPNVTVNLSEQTLHTMQEAGVTIDEVIETGMRHIREETPNALTAKTIRDGRKGIGVHHAKDVEDLIRQLEED